MTTFDPTFKPWENLLLILELGDPAQLGDFISSLPPTEVARTLSRLDGETRRRVLTTIPVEDAANLLEQMADVMAADIIEELPAEEAAEILTEVDSADQADLIAALEEEDAEAILAEMEPEEASQLRKLSAYASDTAGGLMGREYLAYPSSYTVEQLLEDLRTKAEEYSRFHIQYYYVLDKSKRLRGVLRLRDVLHSDSGTLLSSIMVPKPKSVKAGATLQQLDQFFSQYAFAAAPVVDKNGRMLGIVTRLALEEGLAEHAEDNYRKAQGIIGGDELRSMPILERSQRRLSWLSINILLNIAAASVIAFYQDVLASAIALAVFIPIISDMSGCSGNQAVAVTMRELSLGLVRPHEILRILHKEIFVGIVNGLALGILIALAAWLWKGNPLLGLVAGTALAINTVIAVCVGGTIPLVLKRLKRDPALASGPILTTLTDMCGFFLTLGGASIVLPWLS